MNREERVNKAIAEAGILYRTIMQKAYNGSASPRSAVKAMCLQCVGYVRDDITHCSAYSCPLWAFRPYQIKGGLARVSNPFFPISMAFAVLGMAVGSRSVLLTTTIRRL